MKRLALLLTIICSSLYFHTTAQTLSWLKSSSGNYGFCDNGPIAVDRWGNVFGGGFFYTNSDATFDAVHLTTTSSMIYQAFVVKYDSAGAAIWAAGASSGDSYLYDITTDLRGNVYAICGFAGSTSVTWGSLTCTSTTGDAYYVVKLDSAGNVIWLRSDGGTTGYAGGGGFSAVGKGGIAADSFGHIYVTSSFTGSTCTVGSTTLTNSSSGSGEAILAKYDTSGNVIWAKSAGGTSDDDAYEVVVAHDGVYIDGTSWSPTATFGTVSISPPGSGSMAYVARYDTAGNCLWAKPIGLNNMTWAGGLATDASSDVYFTGIINDSYVYIGTDTMQNHYAATNPMMLVLVKFDETGSLLWHKGGATSVPSYYSLNADVSADLCGNVWMCGPMLTNIIWPGGGYTTSSDGPIFMGEFDATGTLLAGKVLDQGGDDWMDIGVDNLGNVYYTDDYEGTSYSIDGISVTSTEGGENFYMAKFHYATISLDTTRMSSDSTLCFTDSAIIVAPGGWGSYVWNDSSTGTSLVIHDTGTYYVMGGSGGSGCLGGGVLLDTFRIHAGVMATPVYHSFDTTLCPPYSISESGTAGYAHYVWNDGTTTATRTITAPGTYYVTCYSSCALEVDTFTFTSPSDTESHATTYHECKPFSLTLTGTSGYTAYTWSTGAGSSSTTISDTGTYWVMCSSTCATAIDSFYVLLNVSDTIYGVDPITKCGACDGAITLHGLPGGSVDTIDFRVGGIWQPHVIDTATSGGLITLDHLCPGTYDSILVHATGVCPDVSGPVSFTDPPIIPSFTFDTTGKGCGLDTLVFTNSSTGAGGLSYTWEFGDGTVDTETNPMHVYTAAGTYTIALVITNGHCVDSVSHSYTVVHPPLKAGFTVSPDSICQGDSISFKNTSSGKILGYEWQFGDGGTDTATNPAHVYHLMGVHTATLVVTDSIHCQATATLSVLVDTISGVDMLNDTVICQGQAIRFAGEYAAWGNTGVVWSFGDGSFTTEAGPLRHSFDNPGLYSVTLKASYRLCPDTSVTHFVTVHSIPRVDLGPDTSMCPGDAPFTLIDQINAADPRAHWLWSTNDTTSGIMVNQPGHYFTTVTINGCSNSDTMWVQNNCFLDIPNAFTPNGDGVNDYFFPRPLLADGLVSFKMDIYNRWGQVVFSTDNISGRGWDGKFNGVAQPEGVFVYLIDASFKNGITEHHKGNVTLLR